jgi:hypothetical protein
MKLRGGIEPPFLTLALDEGERSASHPGHFTYLDKIPWYPLGGWVGPRAGLDTVE